MKKILFLALIIGFLSTTLHAADVLYVQSVKATIFGWPKFSSRLVGEVKRGDKLDVIMSQGRWYKVTTGSLRGWINALCVAQSPPINKVMVIKENKNDLEENARRRASAITSAAAARGLSAADRKRLSDENLAEYHLLGKLKKFTEKITDKEIEQFICSMEMR